MLFFISNTFMTNVRLKLAKSQANAKQHPEAKLLLFENYSYSSSTISSKNNRTYSKKWSKEQLCLCLWDFTIMIYGDFIIMIIMKMKMKIKNRSHRYEINRPSSRHGCKYSKYKKCLSMMILICIKQHLSKIWSSIHEKVKQHWGWVEKKRCLSKKVYIFS